MKKLIAYINKTCVPGIEYRLESFGNDYFYNTPAPIYKGVMFALDFRGSTGEIKAICKAEQKIKKYCARYGYKIINESAAPGVSWFTIVKPEDMEEYEYYHHYVRASVEECEKLRHEKGIYPGLSEDMKKIMEEHENGYHMFLRSLLKAV